MPYADSGSGFQGRSKHNTEDRQDTLGNTYTVGPTTWMYVKAGGTIPANTAVIATVSASTVTNIETQNNTVDPGVGKPWVYDSAWAMTAQAHVGSILYVASGTGAGQMKRIHSNDTTKVFYEAMYPEMGEEDGFSTALSTDSDLVIISPYVVTVSTASAITELVVGVAPFAITSGYYGYIVYRGIAPCLTGTSNAACAAGKPVCPGDDNANGGYASGVANGNDYFDVVPFGTALHAGADEQITPVWVWPR